MKNKTSLKLNAESFVIMLIIISFICILLMWSNPSSFAIGNDEIENLGFGTCIYYVLTISTVGFGNILAVNATGQVILGMIALSGTIKFGLIFSFLKTDKGS